MSKEMRKYIDTFKERLTESENLNISDVRFALMNFQITTELGSKLSYTPCYV